MSHQITPFESIRRTNPTGNEFWSSRDFAKVLDYADYRNFQSVIESARSACFNSGQRVEDHFVEVTDMIEVGKGARRPAKTVMMSRYACYLVIQNADPKCVDALSWRAFCREKLGEYKELDEDADALLKIPETELLGLEMKAEAALLAGRFDDALRAATKLKFRHAGHIRAEQICDEANKKILG